MFNINLFEIKLFKILSSSCLGPLDARGGEEMEQTGFTGSKLSSINVFNSQNTKNYFKTSTSINIKYECL